MVQTKDTIIINSDTMLTFQNCKIAELQNHCAGFWYLISLEHIDLFLDHISLSHGYLKQQLFKCQIKFNFYNAISQQKLSHVEV